MNNTNRALNRTLVAVIGLLTLLIGAALIAIATVPAVRAGYRTTAPDIQGDITGWLKSIPLFDTTASWGWILVLAGLVLIVTLLLLFTFRQGHGHHGTLLTEDTSPAGTTVIDAGVAEQAIQDNLDGRPEFVASSVSTFRVRGVSVLRISAICRRGVSPRDVTQLIENALTALDVLLGHQIPALIQISGGFRARLSRATRTQQLPNRTLGKESYA
jgi:hypothetical protein